MEVVSCTPSAWLIALALTCPGLANAQDPTDAPIQGPLTKVQGTPVTDPRLRSLVDEVVAVVGDEVVTLRELIGEIQHPNYEQRRLAIERLPASEQDNAYGELQTEAIATLVERLLRTRAGEDRGFDPSIVERLADNYINFVREQYGGPIGYRQWLDRAGSDPEGHREWRKRQLYLGAWEGSTTGEQPGPIGRPDRDTFVRPGHLYATYRRLVASAQPEEQAIVGATRGEVVLSEIAMSIDANGGEAATRQLAEKLRRSVLEDGEDFDALASKLGESRRPNYITSDLEGVARAGELSFGNDQLLIFSKNASPGEISPPLRSRKGGIHLFKLVERKPAQEPEPYHSIELQKRLRQYIGVQRDRVRLGQGTEHLLRTVRIQPAELGNFMLQPRWLYRENNSSIQ